MDQLGALLHDIGVEDGALGVDDARRLWSLVGDPESPLFDEFLAAITLGGSDITLAWRVGRWRLDLAESAVRTGVLTALVAGVLIPQGLTEFAVGFVTAVLPSVVDIERVELRAGDRRLLIELRARALDGTEEELYAALPPEVRAVVNRYDFADFMARLRDVGLASGPDGGRVFLWPPE